MGRPGYSGQNGCRCAAPGSDRRLRLAVVHLPTAVQLLKFIHSFLGNWGFSIIVITFIVRGIMYPLTKAQYTSMAKMRMLQPKIQAMRERLGDDKQRQSQEMMALYKAEKVNPLGGCFPLIIQMPIFLALYYMLSASVELRHAPFILWIHDLSAQDPYYILPIIMGATMFFIQKMSPTTVTDLMQQKITDLYAGHLHGVLPVVPVWPGGVLHRQQPGHHYSAAADLPWSGETWPA